MLNPFKSLRFFSTFIAALSGLIFLCILAAALGPDADLHFIREVPTEMTPARLDRNLFSVTRWPQWFFSLREVNILNLKPGATLEQSKLIETGSLLKLLIDPQKTLGKKFELTVEVLEYVPGHSVTMKVLEDTSGRLTRLFDNIQWKIEFLPRGEGGVILGSATARTRHWRSRVFGRMTERIIMNQLFYPDLLKLSELKRPFSEGQDPQLKLQNSY